MELPTRCEAIGSTLCCDGVALVCRLWKWVLLVRPCLLGVKERGVVSSSPEGNLIKVGILSWGHPGKDASPGPHPAQGSPHIWCPPSGAPQSLWFDSRSP